MGEFVEKSVWKNVIVFIDFILFSNTQGGELDWHSG